MHTSMLPKLIYVRDGSCRVLTPDEAELVDELLSRHHENSLPYGWRMSLRDRGVRIPVKHEQVTLAKITELRARGWGRVRITRHLNELGYRPRGRRGSRHWHERTVQVLLFRIDAEHVRRT